MSTREIAPAGWKQFCARVQEACQGALVSIDFEQSDGTVTNLGRDLPLREISWDDRSDPCNSNLVIEAGPEKPVRHVVIEPIHIRLKDDHDDHRYNRLQIVAENGITTAVLHPGLNLEVLNGLPVR